MNEYIAKVFQNGVIYDASDVNRIENQLELLTSAINTLSSLNNIYIRYNASEPEPEDKTVLFIDLSDEIENNTSIVNGILEEYKISIEFLSNELYELKETVSKLISSGGIIVPDDPIIDDTNNYILLEDGSKLLMENDIPVLCENDFENIGSITINNCILSEEGLPIITEDNKYIRMEV